MATILKPPAPLPPRFDRPSVFLAGSIEMGRAELWQDAVADALRDEPLTILNPRRDDWDASWEQSSANPQFVAQVTWELDAQERAGLIAMYFARKPTRRSRCWSSDCSPPAASCWSAAHPATGARVTSTWFARATASPSCQRSPSCAAR